MKRSAQSGFARHIRFVETYDPSLPPVLGNRDQLVQVILNLVKNAAEALVEDGRESVVFVRSSTNPNTVVRQRVKVIRRFRDSVYLALGTNGVHPGDNVVTSGSLLLNEAMNELRASTP